MRDSTTIEARGEEKNRGTVSRGFKPRRVPEGVVAADRDSPRFFSSPPAAMLCAVVVLLLAVELASAGTRPLIMGRRGVVVSGHHLASDAGLDILKKGGNAVDAGVATVFAQAVVEFDRFGFGGEVPVLIYSAKEGRVVSVNGHGQAPMAASIV